MASVSPCQSCGACCAHFRVAFFWREAEAKDSPHPVPLHLVNEYSDLQRCMKGTDAKRAPRCEALSGKVGERVACTIYENRPSPCRNFSSADVSGNHRCDEARLAHGLKPLGRPGVEMDHQQPT